MGSITEAFYWPLEKRPLLVFITSLLRLKKKKSHAQDNSQMTVHLDHDSRRVKCPTQWGNTTASSRHGSRKPRDHILYHKQEVESKLEVEKG